LQATADTRDWFLLRRDHDPQQQVQQNAGHSARDKRDEHSQPEPKGTDPEELRQPAAHTRQYAVAPRAPQNPLLIGHHFELLFIFTSIYAGYNQK